MGGHPARPAHDAGGEVLDPELKFFQRLYPLPVGGRALALSAQSIVNTPVGFEQTKQSGMHSRSPLDPKQWNNRMTR
jgi:hypothetical protein